MAEVVRRTVEERVMAGIECGLDLGPIRSEEIRRQLETYVPPQDAAEREDSDFEKGGRRLGVACPGAEL